MLCVLEIQGEVGQILLHSLVGGLARGCGVGIECSGMTFARACAKLIGKLGGVPGEPVPARQPFRRLSQHKHLTLRLDNLTGLDYRAVRGWLERQAISVDDLDEQAQSTHDRSNANMGSRYCSRIALHVPTTFSWPRKPNEKRSTSDCPYEKAGSFEKLDGFPNVPPASCSNSRISQSSGHPETRCG